MFHVFRMTLHVFNMTLHIGFTWPFTLVSRDHSRWIHVTIHVGFTWPFTLVSHDPSRVFPVTLHVCFTWPFTCDSCDRSHVFHLILHMCFMQHTHHSLVSHDRPRVFHVTDSYDHSKLMWRGRCYELPDMTWMKMLQYIYIHSITILYNPFTTFYNLFTIPFQIVHSRVWPVTACIKFIYFQIFLHCD